MEVRHPAESSSTPARSSFAAVQQRDHARDRVGDRGRRGTSRSLPARPQHAPAQAKASVSGADGDDAVLAPRDRRRRRSRWGSRRCRGPTWAPPKLAGRVRRASSRSSSRRSAGHASSSTSRDRARRVAQQDHAGDVVQRADDRHESGIGSIGESTTGRAERDLARRGTCGWPRSSAARRHAGGDELHHVAQQAGWQPPRPQREDDPRGGPKREATRPISPGVAWRAW